MKETYDFLKECGTFYLATIDNDKPRVRPFGAVNIFEDKIYLITGKVKNVSKQIDLNNHVEICGFSNGKWIRIECELINDDNVDAKNSMLDSNPELRAMYSATDENMQVLYLNNVISTIYSFADEPIVYKF